MTSLMAELQSRLGIDGHLVQRCRQMMQKDEYAEAVRRVQSMEKMSSTLLSLSPIISITSTVVCLSTVTLLIYAINTKKVPDRKYSVLVSRTLSDVFSCLLISFVSFFSSSSSASFAFLALFIYISTFGFLQLSLSHLLILILRQISLSRPHSFSSFLTFRKLLGFIALTWILSILYAGSYAPLTTVILNPRLSPKLCSYGGCHIPLLIVCVVIMGVFILAILSSYIFLLYRLWRRLCMERDVGDYQVERRQFTRFLCFGTHLILFTAISALLLTGIAIVLHNVSLYDDIRSPDNNCRVVAYLSIVVRVQGVAAGAVLLWLIRILADIVFLFIQDYRRLLPWLATRDGGERRLERTLTPSNTIKRMTISCPVFNLEKTPTDHMRN